MVDAGIRHDKAEAVLGDNQIRAMPHNAARFREHDLDKARILAGLGRERDGALRRDDARNLDDAAFGFRDDLLRDNDDIAICELDPRRLTCGQRDLREIVARLHHRHAGEPDNG